MAPNSFLGAIFGGVVACLYWFFGLWAIDFCFGKYKNELDEVAGFLKFFKLKEGCLYPPNFFQFSIW